MVIQTLEEKETFGDWWKGLSGERRQAFLSVHGSHENMVMLWIV